MFATFNRPAFLVAVLVAAAMWALLATPVRADQSYRVTGADTFALENGDVKSEISYDGKESLVRQRTPRGVVYRAQANYRRVDQGASSRTSASFTAEIAPTGEQRDIADVDPDYLTLLNQPFAVQLDAATLADIRRLRVDVPFDFPSPMTGASLHGHLHRIGPGIIAGMPALGVSFDAGGPIHGPVADRPHYAMNGQIRMHGSAYYRTGDALLLLLDATMTISGALANPDQTDRVNIVYRRRIRAEPHPPPR